MANRRTFLVSVLCVINCFFGACVQGAVTFDWISIGNPGNGPDITGFGTVANAYSISKYEVTTTQYTEFLNAVAGVDTNGLYTTNLFGGSIGTDMRVTTINRSGAGTLVDPYTYSVVGDGNTPMTYVNWEDAARFSNWLQNGQPAGVQDSTTTENGVYDMSLATSSIVRQGDANFFLPSEDEWYKAAYHQPAALGGDGDDYWLYPMQTNQVPFSDDPLALNTPDNTKVGNFFKNDGVANGYDEGHALFGTASSLPSTGPNALTPAGAYSITSNYYGTFDQGGNVWEWTETPVGSTHVIRGASNNNGESSLRSTFALNTGPTDVWIGFRVATIPEPHSFTLLLSGLAVGFLPLSRFLRGRARGATRRDKPHI